MLGWDRNFESFVDSLHNGIENGLPGVNAQFKLVPPGRPKPNFAEIEKTNPKMAGVLALFYPIENVPHLVLMKRNKYPGVHSGQISLPGGQCEDHDRDIIQTALRETEEEIGVLQDQIEVKGSITRVFIPPSNFLVQPVIGVMHQRPTFNPEEKEVDELLEVPFSAFFHDENFRSTRVEARGFSLQVPAFHVQNQIIWGATAMMISEMVELLKSTENGINSRSAF